jgi:hypothetical protein
VVWLLVDQWRGSFRLRAKARRGCIRASTWEDSLPGFSRPPTVSLSGFSSEGLTRFSTPSSCPHHRFINHRPMQHVRHIFRGREKDTAGCRRDASPRIHPHDCRFRATIRCSLSTSLRKVSWNSCKIRPRFGNCRFSDIEMALCWYLDRLDKLGLPAQRELLRGAADCILLANWTPTSTGEKPPSVGRHWVSRFPKQYPEYTLKVKRSSIWSASGQNPTRTCKTGFNYFKT